MPGRDGTGPLGAGAMTGRGLGICSGTAAAGRGANTLFGRGRRAGRGVMRGLGFGRASIGAQPNAQTQKELIQQQRDVLQQRLETLDDQLKNM